jgi:hypothetical protein
LFDRGHVKQDGPPSSAEAGYPPPAMPTVNRRHCDVVATGKLLGRQNLAHKLTSNVKTTLKSVYAACRWGVVYEKV